MDAGGRAAHGAVAENEVEPNLRLIARGNRCDKKPQLISGVNHIAVTFFA